MTLLLMPTGTRRYRYVRVNITAVKGGGSILPAIPAILIHTQEDNGFIVPTMTANNAPSPYVALADSEYAANRLAYMAFSNTRGRTETAGYFHWQPGAASSSPWWIELDLGSAKTILGCRVYGHAASSFIYAPIAYTIIGHNGTPAAGTVLKTVSHDGSGYIGANPENYQVFVDNGDIAAIPRNRFRFTITANNGYAGSLVVRKVTPLIDGTPTSLSMVNGDFASTFPTYVRYDGSAYSALWRAFNDDTGQNSQFQTTAGTFSPPLTFYVEMAPGLNVTGFRFLAGWSAAYLSQCLKTFTIDKWDGTQYVQKASVASWVPSVYTETLDVTW